MADSHDRVASLLAQVDALIEVNRFQEAVERARDAAALAPEDPRSFCAWSRALQGQEHFAEAAVMADEAIRLGPESPTAHYLRSKSLSGAARSSRAPHRVALGHEAVRSAHEAVRLAPYDVNCHIALAQSLPLVGDHFSARSQVQEVIRLAPHSPAVWVTASSVAIRSKSWGDAVLASRQALALEPDNYAALNNLGVALRGLGKKREGNAVLAQAARRNPNATTARRNLSRAGINIARIVILVLLIPLGFLAHVGLALYVVFAVASNVVISKFPSLVLRLERWAAPIAMFFSKRPHVSPQTAPDEDGASDIFA
jgi:Flp pilus assembly protein TadD